MMEVVVSEMPKRRKDSAMLLFGEREKTSSLWMLWDLRRLFLESFKARKVAARMWFEERTCGGLVSCTEGV